MTTTSTTTAPHLAPTACYVCGHGQHKDTTDNGGHRFWSNADARAEFAADARRLDLPGHAEARYVDTYRPR